MAGTPQTPGALSPTEQTAFQTLQNGYVAARDTCKEGVDGAQRKYVEIEKKHPGVWSKVASAFVIVAGVLSAVFRPFSTITGFVAGLFLSKHVQKAVDKIKEWFKNANIFVKGLMVVSGIIIPFIPIVGGLTMGALAGNETAKLATPLVNKLCNSGKNSKGPARPQNEG